MVYSVFFELEKNKENGKMCVYRNNSPKFLKTIKEKLFRKQG